MSFMAAGRMATQSCGRSGVTFSKADLTGKVTSARSSVFWIMFSTLSGVDRLLIASSILGWSFRSPQDRRQVVDQRGKGRADSHAAEPAVAQAAHGRLCKIALACDSVRMLDQLPARRGDAHALADPLDQAEAPPSLELADLQADRGLRQIEPPRRGREAAERRHLGEGPELVEIEAAHLQVELIGPIAKANLLL